RDGRRRGGSAGRVDSHGVEVGRCVAARLCRACLAPRQGLRSFPLRDGGRGPPTRARGARLADPGRRAPGRPMLTPEERVMILQGADLLSAAMPRQLLGLAEVAREIEMLKGDRLYEETDRADVLYMVVEGRVRLSVGERMMSDVGPGEAFGTWSLV